MWNIVAESQWRRQGVVRGGAAQNRMKLFVTDKTRHRASTSMYSLTFCVRFLLPECHLWKPAVQTAAVMLRTPPSPASHRPAALADPAQLAVRTMWSYREMDASLYPGFALCCHSNATRAPIENPPNGPQLGSSLYHAPKLHRGPCSIVGVRPRTHTDRHTDARDHNTFCVVYDSRKM